MARFRLRARSLIHPGNALVEADNGNCYIYFADFGELSAAAIDSTLAEAMVQCYEWSRVDSNEWLSLPEIEIRATSQFVRGIDSSEQAPSGI